MSRIAFISDIHGNFSALKSVWDDIRKNNISTVICLGDLVGYYSQINEVIDFLREKEIPTILGNHDYALLHNKGIIDRSKTCTNVLTKQLTYIRQDNFDYLATLPQYLQFQINDNNILCVHGGLKNYIDEYIDDVNENYLSRLDENVTHFVTAHTHKPLIEKFNRVIYANSGSVGQPRDLDPRASYLILSNENFEIRRVEYDINMTVSEMRKSGFPDYISDILYKGTRIGG